LQAHFSLGTAAKTRCFFYQDAMDAGQAIRTVLESMRSKVRFQTVRPYRIVVSGGAPVVLVDARYELDSAEGNQRRGLQLGGAPVVFVDARYELESAEGNQRGGLKLAVSPRAEAPALCFLDEAGYLETFAGAITSLLASIETNGKQPLYSELWTISREATPF